jgi:hypothetical protein
MALDIVVLSDARERLQSVPVEYAEHNDLIAAARRGGAELLLRWAPYYEDATIDVDELPRFANELQTLAAAEGTPPSTRALARRLMDLVKFARREGKPVLAYAD